MAALPLFAWIRLAAAVDDSFVKVAFEPGSHVADVAASACSALAWGLSPNKVRLHLVARAGEPKPKESAILAALATGAPLDEEILLASAGVASASRSGAWLVARPVAPAGGGGGSGSSSAPAYAPLEFTTQDVGGASMCVAMVPLSERQAVPLFLAPEHHADLLAFIAEPPSATPQLLLVTGTVKSGKTQLVMGVLPRLLAAVAQARAAAVFTCTFRQGEPAEGAAALLVESLCAFAAEEGVALARSQGGGGLNHLTRTMVALARALWARGRLLWVLLDELGAPLVASTPAAASLFVETLKITLGACCSMARFVATGSGMLTLLEGLRAASVQGFTLSAALVPISLGREPPASVAAAMAQRILQAYAPRWAARGDAAEHFTPQRLLDAVARGAHCGITSPRPALLAFLADSLGSVRKGSPAQALEAALRCVLGKLREECEADAAVALGRLPLLARQLLRALADEGSQLPLPALQEHFKGVAFMGAMVETLCEGDSPARLMPPYAALLRSWVSPTGVLAVHCAGGGASGAAGARCAQGPGAFGREEAAH